MHRAWSDETSEGSLSDQDKAREPIAPRPSGRDRPEPGR
jgi:hypothetical protein